MGHFTGKNESQRNCRGDRKSRPDNRPIPFTANLG
jgi:hypothetical protein